MLVQGIPSSRPTLTAGLVVRPEGGLGSAARVAWAMSRDLERGRSRPVLVTACSAFRLATEPAIDDPVNSFCQVAQTRLLHVRIDVRQYSRITIWREALPAQEGCDGRYVIRTRAFQARVLPGCTIAIPRRTSRF